MENKPQNQKSALIAMSGGVDSTVSALLTLRSGYDCAGAIMKLHPNVKDSEADARSAAKLLNIPFYVLNLHDVFANKVIDNFVDEYNEGRTPNPCVVCNKNLKFGQMLDKANELKKKYIVTGHYAQIWQDASGRYQLSKGVDPTKDQSYVLYTLTQHQLANTLFPLGGMSKAEVREIAHSIGFENASKSESQDICFVPGGDYAKFIEDYTGKAPKKGRFVDTLGNDLGENKGILHYTIGQRRGLGLAMPHPPYVVEIRPEDNTVVIGKNDMLYSKVLYIRSINLISFDKLETPIKAKVKIRYTHVEQPALVRQLGDDELRIEFDEPQRAITKGQTAVIYDGNDVLGGGTIV